MIAVTLALLSAVCYGTSDFIGGVLSARVSPWTAGFTGSVVGGVLVAAYAAVVGGDPTLGDIAWGALSGVGGGIGVSFLYRGLARGRMGVVAPLSGVVAALVPAVVGLASGERPSLVAGLGALLALPASYLVARTPSELSEHEIGPSGATDGLLAGIGFGVGFASIAQTSAQAGAWPVVADLLTAALVIAVTAVAARGEVLPRTPAAALTSVTGVLAAIALALFVSSTHHGLLSITGIIASLYPAATVVLAIVVLREHVHRSQALGLALCVVAVVLVSGG